MIANRDGPRDDGISTPERGESIASLLDAGAVIIGNDAAEAHFRAALVGGIRHSRTSSRW